jgi:hypothetical protein
MNCVTVSLSNYRIIQLAQQRHFMQRRNKPPPFLCYIALAGLLAITLIVVNTEKVMDILLPAIAMMGLTAIVWVVMYVQRLGYMLKHKVDAQAVNTPEKMQTALPESVQLAANNLKNLFELPVLFYAVCIITQQLGAHSALLFNLAWVYVTLRALHSYVHIGVNNVNARFGVYMASSIVLWAMVVLLALVLV